MGARTSSKKRQHDGVKRKRKGKFSDSNFEVKDSEAWEHHDDKQKENTLPFYSFVDVQMKQLDVFLNGEARFEGF